MSSSKKQDPPAYQSATQQASGSNSGYYGYSSPANYSSQPQHGYQHQSPYNQGYGQPQYTTPQHSGYGQPQPYYGQGQGYYQQQQQPYGATQSHYYYAPQQPVYVQDTRGAYGGSAVDGCCIGLLSGALLGLCLF